MRHNEFDRDLFGYYNTANLGTPLASNFCDPTPGVGVRLGMPAYFRDWYPIDSVRLYDVKTPYARFDWMTGYNRGQFFGAVFSMNVSPRLNVTADYHRTNARGDYFGQDNLKDHLELSSHYRTFKNRYSAAMVFMYDRAAGRESGGIVNRDEFANPDSMETNRELVDMRFSDARYKARQSELFLKQNLALWRDTATGDRFTLYEISDFVASVRRFSSGSTGSIGRDYFTPNTTNDSVGFKSISNKGGLEWISDKSWFNSFSAGVGYDYATYGGAYFKSYDDALFLEGKMTAGAGKPIRWNASGRFNFGGTLSGAYQVQGELLGTYQGFSLSAFAGLKSAYASMFERNYFSNQFIWQNHFELQNFQWIGGRAQWKNYFKAQLEVRNMNHLVYYNEEAMPMQSGSAVSLVRTDFEVNIPFSGWLHFDNKLSLQAVASNEDVLRLPPLTLRSAIYADYNIFNKALYGQVGLIGRYFSSYYANAYEATNGVFHLQNDYAIGDFPYFDFYFNFRIQSALIFFSIENVFQGLTSTEYYAMPYYPLADRTFRLGFSWTMFD